MHKDLPGYCISHVFHGRSWLYTLVMFNLSNLTLLALSVINSLETFTLMYNLYINISHGKNHRDGLAQWSGNSQSCKTLSDKLSECLINWNLNCVQTTKHMRNRTRLVNINQIIWWSQSFMSKWLVYWNNHSLHCR